MGAAQSAPSSSVRLAMFPVDSVHYDVCLFEMEPGDNRAKVTRLCRPQETPLSVGMRIPAIVLVLKKSFRSDNMSSSDSVVMGVVVGGPHQHVDPMLLPPGHQAFSMQLPPALSQARIGTEAESRTSAAPLLHVENSGSRQRIIPQHVQSMGTPRQYSVVTHDAHDPLLSSDLTENRICTVPAEVLERFAALYRIPHSDVTRWCQLERMVRRAPLSTRDAWLQLAADTVAQRTRHTQLGSSAPGSMLTERSALPLAPDAPLQLGACFTRPALTEFVKASRTDMLPLRRLKCLSCRNGSYVARWDRLSTHR